MIKNCCERALYYLECNVTDGKVRWLPKYRFWQYDKSNFRPKFQYCPFCGQKFQEKIIEE